METNLTPATRRTRFFPLGLLCAALFSSPLAHGQEAPQRATFIGLSAGLGSSLAPGAMQQLDMSQGSYLAPTGGLGGAVSAALLTRVQRGRWFAQPELRYQEVFSAPFEYPGGGGGYGSLFSGRPKISFHARQFAGSALGGYYFGPQQQYYALFGPAVAFRHGNDAVPAPNPTDGANSSYAYVMDQAPEKTQWQLHGGVGRWGKHFDVELRYAYGLTPLVRQVEFNNQAYDYKVRASTLTLTLGYHLPL
ncbi:hypothetical protein [Hymenobacter properus]|uniref:Outer membrane protein beta-barrel domain-containing protein n=1 Tax=Hymenobacter properus TaxID=2791026 RepID=A0A931BID6_9BACT|nr:hypothetical protein [Hymenobacter properus]MBF9142106.1 hypothetical protein [Hymenobacter properus]MBR7720913.1 hypothetical protein [Microvirga sp. SRT04]